MNTQRPLLSLILLISAAQLHTRGPVTDSGPVAVPAPTNQNPEKPEPQQGQLLPKWVAPQRFPSSFIPPKKDDIKVKAEADEQPDDRQILDKYGHIDTKLINELQDRGNYNPELLMQAFPSKAILIGQQLKETPLDKPLPAYFDNKAIFYGPKGTGKSALIKQFAKDANCEFVKVLAPALVNEYQGSGAQNIRREIESARALAKSTGKRVVLCIEEVDAIAKTTTDKNNNRTEESATQTMWLMLDDYKQDPHVFFILTTNHFDKLNGILRDRFRDTYLVEFSNPARKLREDVIKHYLKIDQIDLSQTLRMSPLDVNRLISSMADKSNHMSIRALENMVHSMKHHIITTPASQPITRAGLIAILKMCRAQSLKKDAKEVWDPRVEWGHRISSVFGLNGIFGGLQTLSSIATNFFG